jgi:hypothetical protein
MRRGGAAVLLVTAVVGVLALAILAASDKRDLAFTIGVVPSIVAADLRPGAQVCQVPVAVPEAFTRVRLRAGSPGDAGPPLELTVLDNQTHKLLGRGRVPGGYPDPTEQSARVGDVAGEQRVAVCVRNVGARRVGVYGNTDAAAPTSRAFRGNHGLPTDLTLVFLRSQPRSMVSALPDALDRASVFRPGWVGPWLYWVLAAAVLLGIPVLLARALAAAEGATAAEPDSPAPPARGP